LLASVEVNAFHATEAYSSLDLTKVKYVRRLSIVEKVVTRIRLKKFNALKLYSPHVDENKMLNKEKSQSIIIITPRHQISPSL
jgi:hypothetical protein